MSYNTLLSTENFEELQYQSAEAQKLLASHIPGMAEIPEFVPTLYAPNYELSGLERNINMLPSPETDSIISSPSVSNPDDELDLFGLQPSLQEQEQLLNALPIPESTLTEIDPIAYQSALMNILANNQVNPNIPVCDPLININDDNYLINGYQEMITLKNQSPVMNPLDLTATGINGIPMNALDILGQQANIEMPPLVPSTIESGISQDMMDPLLIGATDPFIMNEILEANNTNKVNKLYLNNNIGSGSFEQITTPPHSPSSFEALKNVKKLEYIQNAAPIAPMMESMSTPSTTPSIVMNEAAQTISAVPSPELIPMMSNQIPTPMYSTEIENKNIKPIIATKTNYTYVPVKKRSNSDLKGGKIERKSSTKASQKSKSLSINKDKTNKPIQKQQIKHTFVIETPGANYGKKTSGRKRKSKKGEDEIQAELPQIPQVPCRPNIMSLPPQKLSKIRARTSEDLDSKLFQCEYCPSSFSRKHDLKRHIKIHIGSTPAHKCKSCGKSYARIEALAKHEAGKECQK